MTTQIEFTPEIIDILNYERYRYPVPLVQRRMWTLWLKSQNFQHGQIVKIVDVTENTVREYFQMYIDGKTFARHIAPPDTPSLTYSPR